MLGINWKTHTYASLPSTQDYVRELDEEGLPEGLVVQCLEQRKGRGRQGREWVSPMGNLYMSFLLRPHCKAGEAGQISFIAALAISKAIDGYLEKGHEKTLKWPNDVLIDGKKCAGILLESRMGKENLVEGLVVGIGVNIMSAPTELPDDVPEAICLKDVCGNAQLAIHPFRDDVLTQFSYYYKRWQNEGFATLKEDWLTQAHGLGKEMRARLPDETISGLFKGLDEDGALRLKLDDGTERLIYSADVFFKD